MDIAARARLLHETAEHHDPYEKTHTPQGNTPEQAAAAAGRNMAEVLGIAAV